MSKEENKELCKLININKDACSFYEDAQDEVESPRLKQTFGDLRSLHDGVIRTLQSQVRANGGDPEAEETFVGKTSQFWSDLVVSVSNDVDETLVRHLEEAEDRCLHSMQDAVDSDDVLPGTKSLLIGELSALRKSHDYMKALKESLKAA